MAPCGRKRTKGLPVDICCYLTVHAFKLTSPSPHPLKLCVNAYPISHNLLQLGGFSLLPAIAIFLGAFSLDVPFNGGLLEKLHEDRG